MTAPLIGFDVAFSSGAIERVNVEVLGSDPGARRFSAADSHRAGTTTWLWGATAEQCATMWATSRMRSHGGAGVASIRRVEVKRAWSVMEARDMSAWRALVLAAVDAGVVFRGEWDDGNGLSPWYIANPGDAERDLYNACCARLDEVTPVEDAELIEMEERANASIDDDDPAVRAIARDSIRLGYEVLRLRNEVFLAQRRLVAESEVGHGDADTSGGRHDRG